MKRWLFNFAAAVSLLLCLAIAYIWLRSYWVSDYYRSDVAELRSLTNIDPADVEFLRIHTQDRDQIGLIYRTEWDILWGRGGLRVTWDATLNGAYRGGVSSWNDKSQFTGVAKYPVVSHDQFLRSALGFSYSSFNGESPPGRVIFRDRMLQIIVPIWSLVVPSSVLPIIWILTRRRARLRLNQGMCVVCGYDLRATPERCPECGTIPTAAKGAAI